MIRELDFQHPKLKFLKCWLKIKQSVDIQLEDTENQFSDQFQTCTVLYKHKINIINQSVKYELLRLKKLEMRAKMVFESNFS